MKKTEKIIIDAEPQDVAKALMQLNDISPDYEIKEFTYSLSKIADKDLLDKMDLTEYKITHCRLELIKKVKEK
ncbi:MAG: hypothetical protein HQ594_06145 [Candidatus Omnitrophica bacterium]|nr:hypothetical protein [Candidatus Omnitrophota bacterium]